MKQKLLIITTNSVARIGLQSYLSSLLSGYLHISSVRAKDVTALQLESAQCILYSAPGVKDALVYTVPDEVRQIICIRTFNHTFLHKVFQIPPGSTVYLVNDTEATTYEVLRQLQEFGITQYHLVPYYPGVGPADPDIHYAVTFGELHLVPATVGTVIDLGNRVADISTINEIIAHFRLPSSLADEITRNYVNHIVQIIKLSNAQLSQALDTQHITQVIINHTEKGICLLDDQGQIKMINRAFTSMLCLAHKNLVGSLLSSLLSDNAILLEPNQAGEYMLHNNLGQTVRLWIQEIDAINHTRLSLLHTELLDQAGENLYPSGGRQVQNFSQIITKSPQVLRLLEHAKRISLNDFHLVIQGESGTEKEMLAQSIHNNSRRHDGPFVTLNMISMEPTQVKHALLGSEHGEIGYLEAASGGTLFINGIHHMPASCQALLLRILQDGCYQRAGQQDILPFSARIIATTCKDLYPLVASGEFLDELFFTLHAVSLVTVPLRQRKDDIPLLIRHFLKNIFNNPALVIEDILTESLIRFFYHYSWPGNAQEVHNVCKYISCVYSQKPVGLQDLPSYILNRITVEHPHLGLLEKRVLEIVESHPRCGRSTICNLMGSGQAELSDGRVRTILQHLSERGYIKIHKTKGGCEITELGMLML